MCYRGELNPDIDNKEYIFAIVICNGYPERLYLEQFGMVIRKKH